MEQSTQSASQQQGRQQPVYDTRNGGHYGNHSSNLRVSSFWRHFSLLDSKRHLSKQHANLDVQVLAQRYVLPTRIVDALIKSVVA